MVCGPSELEAATVYSLKPNVKASLVTSVLRLGWGVMGMAWTSSSLPTPCRMAGGLTPTMVECGVGGGETFANEEQK